MGKQALQHLSEYIGKKIKESKEYRATASNYKTHRFTLTEKDLIDEMLKQLGPVKKYARLNGKRVNSADFNAKIAEICSQATPKILQAVAAKSRVYEIDTVDPNTVEIRSMKDGQNIFDFIKGRYRPVFNTTVRDRLVNELFNSFNSTRAYRNLMSQDYEAYEESKISGSAYAKKTHELNRTLFGYASTASRDSKGNTLDYFRKGKQIQLTGGSANLGHINSVSEQRALNVLEDISNQLEKIDTPDMGVLTSYFRDMPDIVIDIIKEVKVRRSNIISGPIGQNMNIVVTTIHSSEDNQERGRTEDKRVIQQLKPAIMRELKKHDWANTEGSDTYMETVEGLLFNSSLHTLTKGKRGKLKGGKPRKLSNSPSSAKSVTKASSNKSPISKIKGRNKSTLKEPNIPSEDRPRAAPIKNWSSLLPILNAKLTPRVIANMRFPSLVNRTGTFANSAKVVNIEQTREGFPTFVFDYERDPYNVFDKTQGRSPWNTPQRDPRALVDKSVREVVREMAIGRFYTRRA
jgi:hypothetical protein